MLSAPTDGRRTSHAKGGDGPDARVSAVLSAPQGAGALAPIAQW